ncbi:hypothetical protein BDW66DRAFT_153889 [Aspergillus desertorum]
MTLSDLLMATVSKLFGLDYNVPVIRDIVLELPVEQTAKVAQVMVDMLLPKI